MKLQKQPAESRLYKFDFSNNLSTNEVISSVNSLTFINLGYIQGSSNITLSGSATISNTYVEQRILGGQDGERYKVTCIVTTSDSNILEVDGILYVTDN